MMMELNCFISAKIIRLCLLGLCLNWGDGAYARDPDYETWSMDNDEFDCLEDRVGCRINFRKIDDIKTFEDWVYEFRTGKARLPDKNVGFDLGTVGRKQALRVRQSSLRDGGGSRRTEAKVAKVEEGDYQVSFKIFFPRDR